MTSPLSFGSSMLNLTDFSKATNDKATEELDQKIMELGLEASIHNISQIGQYVKIDRYLFTPLNKASRALNFDTTYEVALQVNFRNCYLLSEEKRNKALYEVLIEPFCVTMEKFTENVVDFPDLSLLCHWAKLLVCGNRAFSGEKHANFAIFFQDKNSHTDFDLLEKALTGIVRYIRVRNEYKATKMIGSAILTTAEKKELKLMKDEVNKSISAMGPLTEFASNDAFASKVPTLSTLVKGCPSAISNDPDLFETMDVIVRFGNEVWPLTKHKDRVYFQEVFRTRSAIVHGFPKVMTNSGPSKQLVNLLVEIKGELLKLLNGNSSSFDKTKFKSLRDLLTGSGSADIKSILRKWTELAKDQMFRNLGDGSLSGEYVKFALQNNDIDQVLQAKDSIEDSVYSIAGIDKGSPECFSLVSMAKIQAIGRPRERFRQCELPEGINVPEMEEKVVQMRLTGICMCDLLLDKKLKSAFLENRSKVLRKARNFWAHSLENDSFPQIVEPYYDRSQVKNQSMALAHVYLTAKFFVANLI